MSMKVAVVLFSLCLSAISLSAADPVDASKVSPGIAQVVKMHDAGVADDVLFAYVRETAIPKPSAEEVLYLTEKGIPKDVIVTLLSKKVWSDTPAPQSQPQAAIEPHNNTLPPAVANAQPATQSVVVQQPAPTVTYVGAPYYPYYSYYPSYYPYYYGYGPTFSVVFVYVYGYGHGWHGGGWHHGGGIHVHHR